MVKEHHYDVFRDTANRVKEVIKNKVLEGLYHVDSVLDLIKYLAKEETAVDKADLKNDTREHVPASEVKMEKVSGRRWPLIFLTGKGVKCILEHYYATGKIREYSEEEVFDRLKKLVLD